MPATSTPQVLDELRSHSPLLITDRTAGRRVDGSRHVTGMSTIPDDRAGTPPLYDQA